MIEILVLGVSLVLFVFVTFRVITFKDRRLEAAMDGEFEDLESAPEMPGSLTGRGINPSTGLPR